MEMVILDVDRARRIAMIRIERQSDAEGSVDGIDQNCDLQDDFDQDGDGDPMAVIDVDGDGVQAGCNQRRIP